MLQCSVRLMFLNPCFKLWLFLFCLLFLIWFLNLFSLMQIPAHVQLLIKNINVVINFLSQVHFIFLLFQLH